MGKYFGTDGVRGIANDELTPHLAYKIGRAGAFVLEEHSNNKNTRTRVIIGTDTRISKDLLSASIAATASPGWEKAPPSVAWPMAAKAPKA